MPFLAKAKNALTSLLSAGQLQAVRPLGRERSSEALLISPRTRWMDETQGAYFDLLSQIVAGRGYVIPKVRLANLVELANPTEHLDALVRMDRRSLDFLLCDLHWRPCCVVLLVDNSTTSTKLPADYAVGVLGKANIPVIELDVARSWTSQMLMPMLPHVFHDDAMKREKNNRSSRSALSQD